jgi:Homeodomain-like domain
VRRLDEDRRSRAEAWLEEGLSPSTIAHKIGCSTRTIERIRRRLYDETAPTGADDRDEYVGEDTDRGIDDKGRTYSSRRDMRPREAAGSRGGIAALVALVCGMAGIAVVRRWVAARSIGTGARSNDMTALLPLRAGAGVAPRMRTAGRFAPRTYDTVAPYPGDDAIFGPDRAQRPGGHNPASGLFAYAPFATFPNTYDFVPESDVDG